MRTRLALKLNNAEIEEYLSRNNLAMVAFGSTCENGFFPVDAFQTLAEAFALKMAEKADGLVFSDLGYFYGSDAGIGAIHMTVEEGEIYLEKLALSLLRQGFRRQIYISASPQGWLTGGVLAIDFFDDTKMTALCMDIPTTIIKNADKSGIGMNMFNDIMLGAYKITNRLNELKMEPNAGELPAAPTVPDTGYPALMKSTSLVGAVGFIAAYEYRKAVDGQGLRSEAEKEGRAAAGEAYMDKVIEAIDPLGIAETLGKLDRWTHDEVLPRYTHLPRNKYPGITVDY